MQKWKCFIGLCLVQPLSFAAPARVDLRQFQTPIRHQGVRGTCITFSALAALEAALKRVERREYDLSEQFLNHMGKNFWLNTNWREVELNGNDAAENQVGLFGGGVGVGYVKSLNFGLRVPEEQAMPYRNTEYTERDHRYLAYDYKDPFWRIQRNLNDVNLDPQFLPASALNAKQYFWVKRYRQLRDARSITEIENALAQGREVVWDFKVANTDGPIWLPCRTGQTNCPDEGHSMLLVGYDRTSPNRKDHYFIAKNSWGPTDIPGANGFTYLSYDYIRYGAQAAYIDEVGGPAPWPELSHIGRWSATLNGWRGEMDLYHIPGISQAYFNELGLGIAEKRAGAFYLRDGRAFKVNGSMQGEQLKLFINFANPVAKWDDTQGHFLNLYPVLSPELGETRVGFFKTPDSIVEQVAYLRKGGLLEASRPTPRPYSFLKMYLRSEWESHFNWVRGTLRLEFEDDAYMAPHLAAKFHGLRGSLVDSRGGRRYAVYARVQRTAPENLYLDIPDLGVNLKLQHLADREHGTMGGISTDGQGRTTGAILLRR